MDFSYIRSDYYRYWGHCSNAVVIVLKALLGINHAFSFQFWFRLSQQTTGLMHWLSYCFYSHYCKKYCIYMPLSVKVGYGLYMGHCMCMVIGPSTAIGDNCNLSQFLNIGSNEGKTATIGNDVYIGPHVSIVEDVKIANGAVIGAGSVVIHDIIANETSAGVPARVVSNNNSSRFIINRWKV